MTVTYVPLDCLKMLAAWWREQICCACSKSHVSYQNLLRWSR